MITKLKSLCTSFLLEWINTKGFPVKLCAPTHKAALVLKKYNNYDATTLHSMLALSPKVDILKLDIRELRFFANDDKKCLYHMMELSFVMKRLW